MSPIRSPADLKSRLVASGIAAPADIAGCTPDEIGRLERTYGRFPDSYREVLAVIGHRAGWLVDDREFWIYADQLDRVNDEGREAIRDFAEDGVDLGIPGHAFFISARYQADYPHYLLTGNIADSPVWVLNGDHGTVRLARPSVWAWIEDFVVDAETFIQAGAGGRNARRG